MSNNNIQFTERTNRLVAAAIEEGKKRKWHDTSDEGKIIFFYEMQTS
jgi:hypothetical protein